MRAMLFREFGGPDVIHLEEVATPGLASDYVRVEVEAVSVNRTLDLAVRAGRYARPVRLPHVLGADPSGTIVEVGIGVTTRKLGDRVVMSPAVRPATATEGPTMLGVQVWGGYAEFVNVPASITHIIPDNLDILTATVVARHAPMALHLLRSKAALGEGQSVLVMGASGGLGSAGVQVAKHLGATVIAAAGADDRVAKAEALGADFGINYRSKKLDAEVMRLTDGRGVDVVFENIADPELFPLALTSLARQGRLVTAGSHGGGIVPLNVTQLYLRQLTIMGSTGQRPEDMITSLDLASKGHLKADIARVMPIEAAAEAHALIEAGKISGKIVLSGMGRSRAS